MLLNSVSVGKNWIAVGKNWIAVGKSLIFVGKKLFSDGKKLVSFDWNWIPAFAGMTDGVRMVSRLRGNDRWWCYFCHKLHKFSQKSFCTLTVVLLPKPWDALSVRYSV